MPAFEDYIEDAPSATLTDGTAKFAMLDTDGTIAEATLSNVAAAPAFAALFEPLQLIERKTLVAQSGTGTYITFSSIPQTFSDLVFTLYATGSTTTGAMLMRFNADASSVYDNASLGFTTAAAAANTSAESATSFSISAVGAAGVSATFTLPGYASTLTNKTIMGQVVAMGTSTPFATVRNYVGQWRSTAAITSLAINGNFTNGLATGSILSLYGRK